MLKFEDLVMLAEFIRHRENCGGAVKVYEQNEYDPVRVVIDWPMTEELVDEYNRLQGHAWTTKKPTRPGRYWLRNWRVRWKNIRPPADPEPRIVEVSGEGVLFSGDEMPIDIESVSGEWAGPLEPPV